MVDIAKLAKDWHVLTYKRMPIHTVGCKSNVFMIVRATNRSVRYYSDAWMQ